MEAIKGREDVCWRGHHFRVLIGDRFSGPEVLTSVYVVAEIREYVLVQGGTAGALNQGAGRRERPS